MYVYVDILFILNLIMNTVILMLTAQAAGFSHGWRRLLLTAAAGSLYAIGAVLPEMQLFYSLPVKLLASAGLVIMAFGFKSIKMFLFALSMFYIISFILGGSVVGWLFFVEDGQWLTPGAIWAVSWLHVAGGGLVASVLLVLIARSVLSRLNRGGLLHEIIIQYSGRTVKLTAMLDTGNRLISPLSKRPVLLIEKEAVFGALSEEVTRFLNSYDAKAWLTELEHCHDSAWLERIEPIPYKGIGSRSMLLGFRPDKIIVNTGTANIEAFEVIIGIYGGTLSQDGGYQALLHPLIIEGREVKGRRKRADQVANY